MFQWIKGLSRRKQLLEQANFKVGMLDKVPTPVMAIDTEFNVIYMNQTGAAAVGRTPEQCIGAKCFDLFKTFQCNTPECAVGRCMREKKVSTNDTTAQLPSGNLPIRYSGTPLLDGNGKVIGGLEFVVDISEENRAVAEVGTLVDGARQGNLELRGNPDNYTIKGFKSVISGVNDTLDAFVRPIKEISAVLEKASEKDLCARVTGEYKGSFEEFKVNVNMTLENLQDALKRVSEAVEQVNSASSQIAVGSQGLAEGASEQASSLEEISSSLEELSSMTRQNADNAKQAKELSGNARDSAFKGGESMKKMTEAIGRIKESSDQTAKILKTIDEIAFQTNLLALNAAVEAARAGESGKGFAVVAEEVRSLAQRSAEAAKNTAQMIESAVKNAEGGVQISGEMSVVLKEIVDTVSKAGDLVSEISAAAVEQSQGIEQISTAVSQMDQVTQNNASNSEESAAAAEELNGQSNELKSMVDEFRLHDSGKQIRRENREVNQHQLKSYKPAVTGPALSKKAPVFSGNGREKTGGLSGNGKLPLSKVHTQVKDAGNKRTGLKASRIIPLDDNDFKNF